MLLDTYAPLKRINFIINFINKKDPNEKRNFTLTTKNIDIYSPYYDKYFETNWNNNNNTWKGIKSLIYIKTAASSVPTVLSLDNGDTITNTYDIANTFNNYFASIAETTKRSIKYSHKHFSDYLANENSNTIFLQPTDKEGIANIINYLNSNKVSGPNSIPYRILLLLKNEISKQLADLINLSFMTGVFTLINATENIRKALDGGNIGCEIFVDLQIAFDTVDHQILLVKIESL